MHERAGSAAAPAVRCRNDLRGNFMMSVPANRYLSTDLLRLDIGGPDPLSPFLHLEPLELNIGRDSRIGHHGIYLPRRLRLFCLDVAGPDHLAPLLSVFGDELVKVGWRACKHRVAEPGDP